MTVDELNRDQLIELKQHYLIETRKNVSWGDLADADDIVSDHTVYAYYEGVDFVDDDFSINVDDDTCRVVIENANRHDVSYDLQYISEQIENGYTNGLLSDGASWYIE